MLQINWRAAHAQQIKRGFVENVRKALPARPQALAIVDTQGRNLLHHACQGGCLVSVRFLLTQEIGTRLLLLRYSHGNSHSYLHSFSDRNETPEASRFRLYTLHAIFKSKLLSSQPPSYTNILSRESR